MKQLERLSELNSLSKHLIVHFFIILLFCNEVLEDVKDFVLKESGIHHVKKLLRRVPLSWRQDDENSAGVEVMVSRAVR